MLQRLRPSPALSPAPSGPPWASAWPPSPVSLLEPCFSAATGWGVCPPASALAVESLPFKATEMPPPSWRLKKQQQLLSYTCPRLPVDWQHSPSLKDKIRFYSVFWIPNLLLLPEPKLAREETVLFLILVEPSILFIFSFCQVYLFIIYFNWRLISLQYCGGFFIHWRESAMGVRVSPSWTPPPTYLPIPSLGSSQCTGPEHPVSCIKPGLAICFTYGNIHVSVLFSQIIPPLPSPTESKRLFYTSVSLLLSHI